MNWPFYLLQINIHLLLFYLFYALILQNETFFKWNRVYLIASAALSFLIPLIQSDWIRSMFVTNELVQVADIINPFVLPEVNITPETTSQQDLTIYEWCLLIYFVGALIFSLKFIWQLWIISISFQKSGQAHSFFRKIKVSDHLPSRATIVKHEEIHAKQFHSADVLLFELVSIINWFNPVVYFYKKSAKCIHEFIADEAASKESGKTEYALLLVSNVFGIQKEQLTNNFFNHSLIKKRIMMLHRNKSKKVAILKYGLSAPLFAAMIIFSSAAISNDDVKSLKKIQIAISSSALDKDSGRKKVAGNTKIQPEKTGANKKLRDEVNAIPDQLKAYNTPNSETKDSVSNLIKDTSRVYNIALVDVMPEYPGGISKFLQWVGSNYKFPKAALEANVSGRMIVQFVIEKDGTLTDIKVPRSLGYGTAEAAEQLLIRSSNWKPGIQNGRPVRVQYTMPLMLKNTGKSVNLTDTGKVKSNTHNISSSKNPPLILIDGKEVTMDYMKRIDPKEIQSISVLKDKNATEIYGDKGKNGVLIIILKNNNK